MATILISKKGNFIVHISESLSTKDDGFIYLVCETGYKCHSQKSAIRNGRIYLKKQRIKFGKLKTKSFPLIQQEYKPQIKRRRTK